MVAFLTFDPSLSPLSLRKNTLLSSTHASSSLISRWYPIQRKGFSDSLLSLSLPTLRPPPTPLTLPPSPLTLLALSLPLLSPSSHSPSLSCHSPRTLPPSPHTLLLSFPIKAPPPYMCTYHWSLRMSKQMAPVTELMLGCHILVTNFTCGSQKVSL